MSEDLKPGDWPEYAGDELPDAIVWAPLVGAVFLCLVMYLLIYVVL